MPDYFITSSESGEGREEILEYIEVVNSAFFEALDKS
jgi:hypothetical protein